MMPRLRELGYVIGHHPTGPLNAITDVAGVAVGHVTLIEGARTRTGVTAILPHGGNLFQRKVRAGLSVLNGFGKFAGSSQIVELGTLETPILLTNTLAVGRAMEALVAPAVTILAFPMVPAIPLTASPTSSMDPKLLQVPLFPTPART